MGHVVQQQSEGLALIERAVVLCDEIERHALLLEDDLLTAQRLSDATQGNNTHQLLATVGHRAKAVYQTSAVGCHLLVSLQAVELAIEQHALRIRGHILVREVELEVGLEGTVGNPPRCPSPREGRLITLYLSTASAWSTLPPLPSGGAGGRLFIPNLHHRLLQYLDVGLVAQVGYEAGLLGTQQVASTTDVEVLHGDMDA